MVYEYRGETLFSINGDEIKFEEGVTREKLARVVVDASLLMEDLFGKIREARAETLALL